MIVILPPEVPTLLRYGSDCVVLSRRNPLEVESRLDKSTRDRGLESLLEYITRL